MVASLLDGENSPDAATEFQMREPDPHRNIHPTDNMQAGASFKPADENRFWTPFLNIPHSDKPIY